jgi:hypothetical protein
VLVSAPQRCLTYNCISASKNYRQLCCQTFSWHTSQVSIRLQIMPQFARRSARSRISKSNHNIPLSSNRRTRSAHHPLNQRSPCLPNAISTRKQRASKQPALAFLARSRDVINADSNRQIHLFALPRELLQQITNHLPLVSVVCLTLTCKEAAEAIGTQSWVDYKKEKRWSLERQGFIELLARDWGDILDFCPRCDTMHPPLQPPRSHRETKLTKYCFGQDAMIDYLPQDASHGYNPVFVHIANAIEESKNFASKGNVGPSIGTLSGDLKVTKNNLSWSLDSSGRRIDGNLIVKHVHTFRSLTSKRMDATDLLALQIRLCPHQSTATKTPERSHYMKGRCAEQNGRLLTHVIATAFPPADRIIVDMQPLKPLVPSEQAQVSASQAGEEVYWRCRSCPTKYRVLHSTNAFTITSWQSFGRDLYHASKYWRWMVRRTGTTLGTDKRNDEWWSPSRTVPDFVCS